MQSVSGEGEVFLDYAPSPVIKGIEWAPLDEVIRLARGTGKDGSDIWVNTWADDGHLYTAYGDGRGFDPIIDVKLSMGFARVEGLPPHIKGVNIRSASGETTGQGPRGGKPSGILMVDGILYLLVRNMANSILAWSGDYGCTWTWADWKFTSSFGCPTFLNYGCNYAGARDDYVYIYSPDQETAYDNADRMILARVPRQSITRQEAYEFFVRLDEVGRPVWTRTLEERGAVFALPGRCYRSTVSYNRGLGRYLWCQIRRRRGEDVRWQGGFAIYDAPEPWGPWTKVWGVEDWDMPPGETNSFPTKWMSADGKTCHLVSSSWDNFCVRRAQFILMQT